MKRIVITLLTDFRNPGGDLEEIEIGTVPKDMTRYELESAKRGWPKGEAAPTLMAMYLAWAALTRTGELDKSFDKFTDHVEAASTKAADVNPTRQAAGEDC